MAGIWLINAGLDWWWCNSLLLARDFGAGAGSLCPRATVADFLGLMFCTLFHCPGRGDLEFLAAVFGFRQREVPNEIWSGNLRNLVSARWLVREIICSLIATACDSAKLMVWLGWLAVCFVFFWERDMPRRNLVCT